jgi:hypothetical protein
VSIIQSVEALEAIYGQPNEASTVKVADRITPRYQVLIDNRRSSARDLRAGRALLLAARRQGRLRPRARRKDPDDARPPWQQPGGFAAQYRARS